MKTNWKQITFLAAAIGFGACMFAANADATDWGKYQVGEHRSGYTYMTDESRAMQNDNFQNPGMLWVEQGAELWAKVDGKAGKSCASCHGESGDSMKGVAARYPVYDQNLGKLQDLEQQINYCLETRMETKPYKWESDEMLSMTTFVSYQSLGMPVNVKVDGPAAAAFEKGKAFYYERRGQLDMACKHCHEDNAGGIIRANTLTQGQGNGFPTYRLKWQKVGSLQRRFRGCNNEVRAKPYPYGSEEYTNLELYVKWRGQGLPIEAPSVRN
ncbi:MAG: sulfur oxidation c-type cytochrome SoxA [Rhodospirillales bacterium]|jgi:L-cysteine S-thiosulfotransferase|nr:sulfur oxidation c-type cytochrome SoxA [Rhodospirillales bacterium]